MHTTNVHCFWWRILPVFELPVSREVAKVESSAQSDVLYDRYVMMALWSLCLVAIHASTVTAQYFHPSWWTRYGLDHIECGTARLSSQPFIGNDAFVDFADVTFHPGTRLKAFSGVKIFLHAADVTDFAKVSSGIRMPFVLLTRSNLDELIPYPDSDRHEDYLSSYSTILEHKQLVGWWGSNKVIQHPKLIALPLGAKWQWHSTEFHGEDDTKALVSKLLSYYALDVMYNFFGKTRERLIYVSMTEGSSDNANYAPWRGSRRKAAQALRDNFPDTSDVDFDTDRRPMISNLKGCDGHPELEKYLVHLQHYKFVLSPAGNGPDAHRTWEALMMGCIPVVLKGPFDELYSGLPVLMLNSWDELTPEVLEQAYINFRYGRHNYSFDKLFTPYWFRTIDQAVHSFHSSHE